MIKFASCKDVKEYLLLKKIDNIVLLSQARSGSTFATHNLSKYLGYEDQNLYPEEYFLNKHFSYVKNFVKKHHNFFMNINEFLLKRILLDREDILFLYLYRDPKQIMDSYIKAKKNGYYKGWNEFYSRYRFFFPNISQSLDTASFNHEIWEYQKKFFRDGNLLPDESLYFLIKFIPFAELRGSANTLFDKDENN